MGHSAVEPFLVEFLSRDYRHIGNDRYYTYPGYKPLPRTLQAVTPRQREVLTNSAPVWLGPDLTR